ELRQLLAGEIDRHGWRLHRIDLLTVDQHLVIEMRTGGDAAMADIGDEIAALHRAAALQAAGEAREMGISGGEMAVMAQADILAVIAAPADILDDTVAGGDDGRAGRCTEIHPFMEAAVTEDRMDAPAEGRGHMGIDLQRPAEIEQSHAMPILLHQR